MTGLLGQPMLSQKTTARSALGLWRRAALSVMVFSSLPTPFSIFLVLVCTLLCVCATAAEGAAQRLASFELAARGKVSGISRQCCVSTELGLGA